MAKIRTHLPRAPITEAVIDLQVRPDPKKSLEDVQGLAQTIDGYETKGPIFQLKTVWSLNDAEGAKDSSQKKELGVRLQTTDDKYVLQIRTNGFTLSRLQPYESWGDLVAEARRLWTLYLESIHPEAISRVATRFINRLKLPMKHGEHFETYLTKPPDVPKELPQGLLAFNQRMVIPHPEIGAQANLIQMLEEGFAPADHVPILLDIDVYKKVDMPADSDEAWKLLEELRDYKNAIFFASLTEKTVELFE